MMCRFCFRVIIVLFLCTVISVNSWTFDVTLSFRSTIRIGEYFQQFLSSVVFIALSFTVNKIEYTNTAYELRRLGTTV